MSRAADKARTEGKTGGGVEFFMMSLYELKLFAAIQPEPDRPSGIRLQPVSKTKTGRTAEAARPFMA
jgi:hypothetical protein